MGKRKSAAAQLEEYELYDEITSVPVPVNTPVYDNCDILRAKIERFAQHSFVTISRWAAVLNLKTSSLTSFRRLHGKGAGAGNSVYQPVYRFFEQMRIFLEEGKTRKRIQAEQNFPNGYPLRHDNGRRRVWSDSNYDPGIYDIDEMARRRRVQGIPDISMPQFQSRRRRRRRRVQVPNRRRRTVHEEEERQQCNWYQLAQVASRIPPRGRDQARQQREFIQHCYEQMYNEYNNFAWSGSSSSRNVRRRRY